jgi:glycosyltransferase involved in cell wall biosynthesis
MSKDEPFGNVYVEALAAGLPVVAHDWSSTRWLFEDQGFLVDTDNDEKIADAVKDSLEEQSREVVAARLALVNRRFTWRAVAAEYARCIRAIVSKNADE